MLQDLHQVSATQIYPIGFKYPNKPPTDSRVFVYSKAGVALPFTYRLSVFGRLYAATDEPLTAAPAVAAGDKAVTVTTTLYVGEGGAGVVAKDELKDGFIEVWPTVGTNPFMFRRITGNDANVGLTTKIYVDKPFDLAAAVGSQVGIHPCPYRSIIPATSVVAGFGAPAGVPPVTVPINNYFWLQTDGRVWLASTGAQPLSAANMLDAYMHSDGTINNRQSEPQVSPARVGYVMGATAGGAAYGLNQIMLQLGH